MGLSGDGSRVLRQAIEQLRELVNGRAIEKARASAARAALEVAKAGWDAHESPSGQAWRPGKDGATGTLRASGRMRSSLRVEQTPRGFALVATGVGKSGGRFAGTHEYGRTIQATGGAASKKPMRWRSPDGRWHSSYRVRVPARPYLPKRSGIPPRWAAAIEAGIRRELRGYGFR